MTETFLFWQSLKIGITRQQNESEEKLRNMISFDSSWEGGMHERDRYSISLCTLVMALVQDVKSGQRHNLMSTTLLTWENTTTAGIQMGNLEASGATPQIQI